MAELAAFLGIAILVIGTPGQDTALTIRNALLGGRRGGVATALGVASGQACWTAAASIGLAALLVASEPVFVVLKLAGAAYLVYLGLQALRQAIHPVAEAIDRAGGSLLEPSGCSSVRSRSRGSLLTPSPLRTPATSCAVPVSAARSMRSPAPSLSPSGSAWPPSAHEVAAIGRGNVGGGLAKRWRRSGHMRDVASVGVRREGGLSLGSGAEAAVAASAPTGLPNELREDLGEDFDLLGREGLGLHDLE